MTPVNRLRQVLRSLAVGCAILIAVSPTASADDESAYNGAPTVISGGPVPTMNGVPCVAGHLGTCTGFAQNSPKRKMPRSTVGHSPTVGP
jgi:hypothetical protein